MTFKDALRKFVDNKKQDKELMKQIEREQKIQRLLEERKKSANERELTRFQTENREKIIKEQLELERQIRKNEGKLNDPTNVPSIFRERNTFAYGNIFSGHSSIQQRNIFSY